jgi:dihydrofolate synthase/folylpolyglutamate synthase
VNDKDISHIIKLLPITGTYYFTKANIPRALDENILLKLSTDAGLSGKSYPNVKIAVDNAKKIAGPNDLIFIGGSTFIVAEAL